MIRKTFIFIFCIALANSINAQDHEVIIDKNHFRHYPDIKRHRIAPLMGFTYVFNRVAEKGNQYTEILVPTIGVNYQFNVSRKWSIGVHSDLEISSYSIIESDQQLLERELAFIISFVGIYEFVSNWSVLAGYGMEFETHQNLQVIRLGTEYEVHIRNDWDVSFGLIYDYKQKYSSFAFTISFGKRLGKVVSLK